MSKPRTGRQILMTLALQLAILAAALLAVSSLLQAMSPGSAANTRVARDQHDPAQTPADRVVVVNEIVASGFSQPLQVSHAGDRSERLFVVERQGLIHVIQGGNVLPDPFLDISQLVTTAEGEQGLLGLAFHPQYPSNGYLYVDYTRAGDGATVVARYVVSNTDPNAADPDSGTTILTVAQPQTNHNGGQLTFGPDGYLYVALGDGGGAGDPNENAQDITTLLGSILRLDVDGGMPYGIPADNPFVGITGRDEIWDYGLRNPWRFSFDRLNGDLYIGDVGQGAWEEIDYHGAGTPGGINFGWDCREGAHDYEFTAECSTAVLVDPIAEYSHAEGRSVTGGFVYRGTAYPDLQGRYFFADFITGKIWSMSKTGSDPDTWSAPTLELDTALRISSLGEDEAGELYVVDFSGGTVRRLALGYRIHLPLVLQAP
jgi:glucose/arabinose dehydrogenase